MSNNINNLRRFDSFEIDLEKKILWIGDLRADVPVKAVELLCMLIEKQGIVIAKDEFLSSLWQESFVEEAVLPQNIYLLRKFFEENGSSKNLIETIPRRGYRFTGNVSDVVGDAQITIERTTIESEFIVEADFNEDDNSDLTETGSAAKFNVLAQLKRWPLVSATLAIVMVVGIFGASWIYSDRARNKAAHFEAPKTGGNEYERLSDSGRAYYVGLSHDKQNAAYVIHTAEGKYSLTLHHLATKSATIIVAPQEQHLHSITFSPDGNYIYYAAQEEKKQNTVYRIPVYGGSAQVVVRDFANKFSLSPDGEWLAFYRWEMKKGVHVEVCKSLDGSERRIVATRSGNETFQIWGQVPEWSPDGKKLVATAASKPDDKSDYKDSLIEIDVSNGRQSPIKTPDWHRIGQSYWERDGKGLFLMVRQNQAEPVQIWHLDYPSGSARNVTNDDNNYREFRVSADSDFLIAATWKISENIYLISSEDTLKVEQLTFDSDVQNGGAGLKWTPDQKQIVYVRSTVGSVGNLWVYDVERKKSRQLTFDKASMQSYVDVSPDGRTAVFGSNRNGLWNIWQIDLDGENLRQLTDGANDGAPEISPDGKWLYYVGKGLWKKPLTGGSPIRVMENTPGTTRVSPVDPDRLISYYGDPDEKNGNPWKFIMYSETNPRVFSDLNLTAYIQFEWKPDGTGIYFTDKGESFNNLWFLSIDNLVKTQLTQFDDQKISNLSLSPDGKSFAVSRGSTTGNVLKISGLKPR